MRTRRNLKGKRFVGSIVAIGWLMTAGTGWGTPIGEEFQVNQFTTGDQEAPDLSALPNGRFIVVWESFFQPDFGYGPRILGQRLDRTDRPMGTEFVVDSTEYYSQKDPRVESWDDGRFVVQWQTRDGQEFPSDAVRARRFGPLGAPVGDDFPVFVVNELSLRIISHDVEAAADGNVLAVYSDREVLNMDPASVETRVRARQFDASNLLLDASVLQSSNDNFDVSVVGDEGSGFVAAWYLPEPPGEKIDLIGAQRFDPTGSRMGSPFPIRPDESFEDGQSIEVSLHPGGDFVAIWDGALDFVGGPLILKF